MGGPVGFLSLPAGSAPAQLHDALLGLIDTAYRMGLQQGARLALEAVRDHDGGNE